MAFLRGSQRMYLSVCIVLSPAMFLSLFWSRLLLLLLQQADWKNISMNGEFQVCSMFLFCMGDLQKLFPTPPRSNPTVMGGFMQDIFNITSFYVNSSLIILCMVIFIQHHVSVISDLLFKMENGMCIQFIPVGNVAVKELHHNFFLIQLHEDRLQCSSSVVLDLQQ